MSRFPSHLLQEPVPPRFQLFGMGHRRKLIFQEGRLKDATTGELLRQWPSGPILFEPAEYRLTLTTPSGVVRIVEDEDGVRSIAATHLRQRGYEVEEACDGEEALDILTDMPGSFDLIISDVVMPGMDGPTLIREAKRLKADLPVIIITGFSTESSAIEAVNLGVAGYLTKPFRVPQVLAAAARALGE